MQQLYQLLFSLSLLSFPYTLSFFFLSILVFLPVVVLFIVLSYFFSQPASAPSRLCLLIIINLFLSVLLSAVHGLSSVPLQQQQPHLSRREGIATLPSHRPLERTRSEPPPYSHSPLTLHASHHSHTQHHLQHHKSGLDRYKLNAHLSKVSGGRRGHKQVADK